MHPLVGMTIRYTFMKHVQDMEVGLQNDYLCNQYCSHWSFSKIDYLQVRCLIRCAAWGLSKLSEP